MFELSRSAVAAWDYAEIQTLKHYCSKEASQIVLCAALPRRTWAGIHAQARRLGLGLLRGGIVRYDETFKAYCQRAHNLQISESSIQLLVGKSNAIAVAISDIPTDETVVIEDNGELSCHEYTQSVGDGVQPLNLSYVGERLSSIRGASVGDNGREKRS